MLTFIAVVAVGLLLLAWSSDKFVDGAVSLARITGLSPLLIGMVIIGFGTSAPELLVSVNAALAGSPGLALGNAVGSNIANIALILGITAMISALPIGQSVVRRELPIVLFAGLFSCYLVWDGWLGRMDGVLLLVLLLASLVWLTFASRGDDAIAVEDEDDSPTLSLGTALFWTAVGLLLLVISSRLLVWGASGIATAFGVSDLVIGLTVVAIGTSLPELAASIASARRGETDLAVGNIVGSNLFNNLGVMGLAALLHPLETPADLLSRDLPIMLALTVLLMVFTFIPPRNMIVRWKAAILLGLFIGYQLLLYFQSQSIN